MIGNCQYELLIIKYTDSSCCQQCTCVEWTFNNEFLAEKIIKDRRDGSEVVVLRFLILGLYTWWVQITVN